MSHNPYKSQPKRAFWSKSVSENFDPAELIENFSSVLKSNDRVVSAGSCFASNLIPYLESVGIEYIRTEKVPNVLAKLGENLGYANFSARYGNVYTARQLRQLYQRATGGFKPIEDRWIVDNAVIDPFRPGLRFPAQNHEEFDFLLDSHLLATRTAFESADVFVFTLGLTEGWVHKLDGAVYPTCPGTVSGVFDSEKHVFKNFSVEEIVADLSGFITELRKINPKIKFILTVSPVPLVATATKEHVLVASTLSKSVLRVAADLVTKNLPNVFYFPAYEIITGPQSPENYFEDDRRNVSKAGVDAVMGALLEACNLTKNIQPNRRKPLINVGLEKLSNDISSAECDEAMLDAPNI